MQNKIKQKENKKEKNIQSSHPVLTFFKRRSVVITSVLIVFSVISWILIAGLVDASQVRWSYLFSDQNILPALTDGNATESTGEAIVTIPERLLDGVIVEESETAHWPVAVMIENLLSVRPQAGLSDASVVYEALAEGGTTRFMVLFDPQSISTEKIGPIRSARQYYIEWQGEYDALYAHAGGSPIALTVIDEVEVKDLEALSRDGVYFWRDTGRSAPHNLYTSAEKLELALRDKELIDQKAEYETWIYEDEKPIEERGKDGTRLTFNFSYGLTYKVSWEYNQANNSYRRFNADQPHTDENTGKQLEAKNVIVQLTEEPVYDGTGKGRLNIYVGGTGDAWVARNGELIKATWKKDSRTDRTRFYDANDDEITLVRGTTWVQVITKTQDVLYE
ncbi:DUF3048 domain-containing protein [Patescibacteria group bacterium]